MKKKYLRIVSAVLALTLMCGCSAKIPKISLNFGNTNSNSTVSDDGNSYYSPNIADIIHPQSSTSSSETSPIIGWGGVVEPDSAQSETNSQTQSDYTPIFPDFVSPIQSSNSAQNVTLPDENAPLLENYPKKWAYCHISEKQRRAYERLFECAKNNENECDIADLNLTKDDIFAAFWAFDYDNPQFLELGSGYTFSYAQSDGLKKMKLIQIDYGRSPSQIRRSEFEETAREVLANAQSQSSDYEKLKYIHDWIVNNTVYSNTNALYESEADGPVVYGKALCEGYAKAFMYFAQSMGFECVCVAGASNGVDHMWNMVKLDGQWYHVDVTWDDPVMTDGSQTLRHDTEIYYLKNEINSL